MHRAAAFCVLLSAPFAILAEPQSPRPFDAASITLSDLHDRSMDLTVTGGRLTVKNWTLALLIHEAYDVKMYQLTGGPNWIDTDPYFVTATADGSPTPAEMKEKLRTLLADRFQLKLHRETRPASVYSLTVAKGGPKLPAPGNHDRSWVGVIRSPSSLSMVGYRATTSLLASKLEDILERPVVDGTGLTQEFDCKLEFANPNPPADASPSPAPSIFAALQDQLGLKLEARKGSMEMLVIDRVERPSAN